jgi:hypothetical protein
MQDGTLKRKIIEEEIQILSSTQYDLSFLLYHVFCLHLCVYLKVCLCYVIPKGDLEDYTTLT